MIKESKIALIIVLLLSAFLFFLSQRSLIYGAGSDPRYTLIVSQSILENQTIALDNYADDIIWGAPVLAAPLSAHCRLHAVPLGLACWATCLVQVADCSFTPPPPFCC